MSTIVISFILSFLTTLLVVRFNYLHDHLTADHDLTGIQKFHVSPVPRIGGLSLIIGLLGALAFHYTQTNQVGLFGLLLLTSALPAFLAGFSEDITKRVGVKVRLIATAISAGLAGYLLGGWLQNLQILGLDNLMLNYFWISVAITCFAVAGVSNSFNIIDGYNGLSGMVAIIILTGIAYVAFQVNDFEIMIVVFAMIGAISGFLIWNYPRGLIFLGDGGAYLIGFWIAECSILLTTRHVEVSKWFPLLLCCYPIFETLFTIYRRMVLLGTHPGMPDAGHLHNLIYHRVIRWGIGSQEPMDLIIRNSLTSPYLWILTSIAVIPAVLFWRHTFILQIFSLFFVIVYIVIYLSIIKFKVPGWITVSIKR